ncbi:unnamed protein product [Leptidea sinapis]|uniref:Uncharacterized protein n=2 Tax=Leptidea sinapis TaxID=189913 RepID=A0A5E4QLG9_9NEOP|nr:unnamed protein product [Leptidea sinapis]
MAEFDVRPDNHLGHIILESMRKYSDFLHQIDAATGEEETYASVLDRSVKLARYLRNSGLVPGDVLAIGGRNHVDLYIPFYSALFNGHTIIGVDPNYKNSEIKKLFEMTSPKVIFCDESMYETYNEVSMDLGLDTKIVTFGCNLGSMRQLLKDFNCIKEDEFKVAEVDIENVYPFFITTSGTTGNIKIAAFKYKALIEKMVYFSKSSNISLHQKYLQLSPINWVSSFYLATANPMMGHCNIQTSIPDNIEIIIHMINKYKPVQCLVGPSLMSDLLQHKDEVDLSSFNAVFFTGSKIYPDVMEKFQACLRRGAIALEAYGQTETIGPVIMSMPGMPRGSCGKGFHMYSLKMLDTETGDEISEVGKAGELCAKGPSFTEYWNDPEETANRFTSDGYVRTGDLLYRDEAGFYYFVERIKTLIKWKNFHVLPCEVEDLIRTHTGVDDVCVLGIKDPEDGELPTACVIRKYGANVNYQIKISYVVEYYFCKNFRPHLLRR